MKTEYIHAISDQVRQFENEIIDINDSITKEKLMDNINKDKHCIEITTHDCDDTIDIDFLDMCFTVHKTSDNLWKLCENASYYPMGFMDENGDDIIDVEITE